MNLHAVDSHIGMAEPGREADLHDLNMKVNLQLRRKTLVTGPDCFCMLTRIDRLPDGGSRICLHVETLDAKAAWTNEGTKVVRPGMSTIRSSEPWHMHA